MATPAVITYAYIRGKWYAFTDQASAKVGVTRYQGNIQSLRTSKPVGVIVDDRTFVRRPASYWPATLANAPGVTGDALINPQVNPIHRPVPVTPDPVVTPTPPAPSGGGGGGGNDRPHPPEVGGGRPNFASYVNQNPDLAAAYSNYVAEQQSSDVDLWETSSTLGGGRPETGPAQLSQSDWGQTHWGQYGQGEKSREGKDPWS
jgi:hypothetical protein